MASLPVSSRLESLPPSRLRKREERDEIIPMYVGADVHNGLIADGQNGNPRK
jgi:hypothetical protein